MDISYPSDEQLREAAVRTGIPAPVLLRDVVRMVEVANLREQGFFDERSVLAGSMALRNFGSPRQHSRQGAADSIRAGLQQPGA